MLFQTEHNCTFWASTQKVNLLRRNDSAVSLPLIKCSFTLGKGNPDLKRSSILFKNLLSVGPVNKRCKYPPYYIMELNK